MNRLANEKSPYLLQHASNPVDWYPWGEEAFRLAKALNKPVFLSIGYSTCHWCHVMAHESFEDPKIAAYLNSHFIPVKLDREERPDIDQAHMMFVQATTGQGGWPMSVWLTPDLTPFYGGTYFPPEDRYGRPGFLTLLQKIHELWESNPEGLATQGRNVIDYLKRSNNEKTLEIQADVTASAIQTMGVLAQSFDPYEGGFGDSPKFPRPVTLQFLFRASHLHPDPVQAKHARSMALKTLEKMADGGMNDQLGGGFHRYSVDALWHVPHFEKMLYDQAQIIMATLDAWQLTKKDHFRRTIEETLEYVLCEMTHPEGGFYSAEDADSFIRAGSDEHAEGAYYVWSLDEIASCLEPESASLIAARFGCRPEGNAPAGSDPHGEFHGKNILKIFESFEALALKQEVKAEHLELKWDEARRRMLAARSRRPRPHLDDKVITAWNGLMISAFARCGAALGEEKWIIAAERCAEFLWKHLHAADGQWLRCWRGSASGIHAFAEDLASWTQACLDLHEATLNKVWLDRAIEGQQQLDNQFWDSAQGGYWNDDGQDSHVTLRLKTDHDGAEPAAVSVIAWNVLRLYDLTGDESWQNRLQEIIQTTRGVWHEHGNVMPLLLSAAIAAEAQPIHITLHGDKNSDDFKKLKLAVFEKFALRRAIVHGRTEGAATVSVCADKVCYPEVETISELEKVLTHDKKE